MNRIEEALAKELEAQRLASVAVRAANARLQALEASRTETVERLDQAHQRLSAASAALASGGGDKDFHAAMDEVAAQEARVRAFDEVAIPEARAAVDVAEAQMPCERRIAVLELKERIQADLGPLYRKFAETLSAQAEILDEIEAVHADLRHEFRAAYPVVFPRDRQAALRDLHRTVPPAVRAFSRGLFVSGALEPVHENWFLPYTGEAISEFLAQIEAEPTDADLAKFGGPVYQPPAPAPAPPPPRQLGPAKMKGWTADFGVDPGRRQDRP